MRHATAKKRTKPVITDNQLKRAVDDAHDHIDHTDHTDYIIETNDPDNINRIRA